jgi:hypothetical protein
MHGHSVAFRRATWKNMQTISIDFFFEKNRDLQYFFFIGNKQKINWLVMQRSSFKFPSTKVVWSVNKEIEPHGGLTECACSQDCKLEEKTALVDSITNSIYDCASSIGCFWWDNQNLDLDIHQRAADAFVYMHISAGVFECLNVHSGPHQCKTSFGVWCVILLGKLRPIIVDSILPPICSSLNICSSSYFEIKTTINSS